MAPILIAVGKKLAADVNPLRGSCAAALQVTAAAEHAGSHCEPAGRLAVRTFPIVWGVRIFCGRRATVRGVSTETAARPRPLRLTQARIGDTLHDANGSRVEISSTSWTSRPWGCIRAPAGSRPCRPACRRPERTPARPTTYADAVRSLQTSTCRGAGPGGGVTRPKVAPGKIPPSGKGVTAAVPRTSGAPVRSAVAGDACVPAERCRAPSCAPRPRRTWASVGRCSAATFRLNANGGVSGPTGARAAGGRLGERVATARGRRRATNAPRAAASHVPFHSSAMKESMT